MAVEARRGCGYRKVGGLYLVSGAGGVPCDRLPFALTVCPTCSHGIKQTRGWTWVNPRGLFGGVHMDCSDDRHRHFCPVCAGTIERAGLLWIGASFYPTPEAFTREGVALGLSRRVAAIPRGFVAGATWVLLAHPKTVRTLETVTVDGGVDQLVHGLVESFVDRPGIFLVWKPERVEKILPESARGSQEVNDLVARGITPVFVPDDDADHRGSVHDDAAELADV